ncbi:hypothetical protein [Microcoleus sp. K1-B6]|uniref:hypothetical protein n=1 Tax=Microcoleus sp. K1-B6 TaxID=2818787 RepID=UPI002FD7A140
MRKCRVVALMVNLIIVASCLPIIAQQSRRYPTENELQQLMNRFRNFVASPPPVYRDLYIRDRRNETEIQKLKAFVRAWLPVNPDVAPFIGQWTAPEETQNIYPSTLKGKVCIIQTFIPPPNGSGISFAQGTVSGKYIKTTDFSFLIQQGNYLGSAFIDTRNNQPFIYEYAWPRPLLDPAQLMSHLPPLPPAERNRLLQQFKEAGCSDTLPKR